MSEIETTTLAAVDLGSNSFHLLVTRFTEGRLHTLDRMKEMVQLGAGFDDKNYLKQEIIDKAVACLKRFQQRLQGIPAKNIRAVGTNALRAAENSDFVIEQLQQALGHPIEIISGREEARLIYLGVAESLPQQQTCLVIDIGGGSTELIVGYNGQATFMESLSLGCVSFSQKYFPNGELSETAINKAILAAQLEIAPIEYQIMQHNWRIVVGSSGTIKAIDSVIQAYQYSNEGITLEALLKVKTQLLKSKNFQQINLSGLSQERTSIFPGGLAILIALFSTLKINSLQVANSALREGLLYDLLGRLQHTDPRTHTVETFQKRYLIDGQHAQDIARTASIFFEQVMLLWELTEEDKEILIWATHLHELGLAISHSSYHKHGAYIVRNADMIGFSYREQIMLSALIRGHRRKWSSEIIQDIAKDLIDHTSKLILILRLAVLLHRNRTIPSALPIIQGQLEKITLVFPENWLEEHPLTQTDLEQEKEYLKAIVKLSFK